MYGVGLESSVEGVRLLCWWRNERTLCPPNPYLCGARVECSGWLTWRRCELQSRYTRFMRSLGWTMRSLD